MSDWQPTPGDDPASVAVMYAGARSDKIVQPLNYTKYNITVGPKDWQKHDLLFLDMPGSNMIKQILMADQPVVYRIRGNLWRAANYWKAGIFKSALSTNILFPRLDGAVAADEWLAVEFQNRTGNNSTASIGLPITASNWPTVTHTNTTLRLLTLTNADYYGKVDPIINYLGPINNYLKSNGGEWVIGGDGRFESKLKTETKNYSNIQYPGFIDAKNAIKQANVLFHPTQFDIQVPNAILEGMASNLPIITNDFPKFEQHDRIQTASKQSIKPLLKSLEKPGLRRKEGKANQKYVKEHHTPKTLAAKYEKFFDPIITNEQ